MMRWGDVAVLVMMVAACGGKKDDKPSSAATGTEPTAATEAERKPAVKLGADEAACGPVIERMAALYREGHPGHAFGSMAERKDGEHYREVMAICSQWSSAEDRACVISAKDYAALQACESPMDRNPAAIDRTREVPACKGGLVDRLACPADAWQHGSICVPAPAGFTAEVRATELEGDAVLTYPDGGSLKVYWGEVNSDCKPWRELRLRKYVASELISDCVWPSGGFAVFMGERGRSAESVLCSAATRVSCRASGSPALEAVCAGVQLASAPSGAPAPIAEDVPKDDPKIAAEEEAFGMHVATLCACEDEACRMLARADWEMTVSNFGADLSAFRTRYPALARKLEGCAATSTSKDDPPPPPEGQEMRLVDGELTGGDGCRQPCLQITGISPTTGAALGGELVELTGTMFSERSVKVFLGGRPAEVVRFDDQHLVVRTPAGVVGEMVDVLVVFEPGEEIVIRDGFRYAE